MKRIILSFDGTWNKPGDPKLSDVDQVETNVCRLHESILKKDAAGVRQDAWYDEGVGAGPNENWFDKLKAGVFGHGLTRNILEGYAELASKYDPGDQIFLFGFSRGAYTARSLAGMIRKCGIVKRSHWNQKRLEAAHRLYRDREGGANSPRALKFRADWSHEASIWFIGVWDTVGALGLPVAALNVLNDGYRFHDTELSGIVEHAYHAIAIDEHRKPYAATLWKAKAKPDQSVEQRWFAGAHADAGGGYPIRTLSDIALKWMQEKAMAASLALDEKKIPKGDRWDGKIHDSYAEFLAGALAAKQERHYRPMGEGPSAGTQTLTASVAKRHAAGGYHPRNRGFKKMLDAH